MLSFKKSKKILNITIEDYVIRIVETTGNDLSSIKMFIEKALPSGLIEHGKIINEIEFYSFMKELVKELKIKNRQIQFNIPDSLVIMRQVDVPASLNGKNEILNYIEMEIGTSIHLPFPNPIIDLADLNREVDEQENETQHVTFFAVPGEEIRKFTEVFIDVSLKPIAADVGILGDYRYFHHMNPIYENHSYMLVEFNINSIHLGVFSGNELEFLRYQALDVNLAKHHYDEYTGSIIWTYTESEERIKGFVEDQVNELERIMNFYRFSLHKGKKMVTDLVLLGDYPDLEAVYKKITNRYEELTIDYIKGHKLEKSNEEMSPAFIPALGLALRGGSSDASRG